MESKSRRFIIVLLSLGVVFAAFVFYNIFSDMPVITIDSEISDPCIIDPQQDVIGKVGDIGVGTFKNAVYYDYGKSGKIVGEFGFERLLHESGSEWFLNKPYRRIYADGFDCFIDSDSGSVSVDSGLGRPDFKEFTLTGNVTVRFIPKSGDSAREARLYLEDITFISERSLFTTNRSVRLESDQASLRGRGFNIVYDEQGEKFDFQKFYRLDKLVLLKDPNPPKLIAPKEKKKPPPEQIVAKHPKPKNPDNPAVDTPQQGILYKCVLSENVSIQTQSQTVLADQIFINNFLLGKTEEDSPKKQTAASAKSAEPDKSVASNGPAKSPASPSPVTKEQTIIRCQGPCIVVPIDSAFEIPEVNAMPKQINNDDGKTIFAAWIIEYDVISEEIKAENSSQLHFYAKDFSGKDSNDLVPVTVTCTRKAQFIPRENKILFEGDCASKMIERDGQIEQEHAIFADRFSIDLYEDETKSTRLKHFTADGGDVKLRSVKKSGQNVLSWVKLKSERCDFDPQTQQFSAQGNGQITLDNSKALAQPSEQQDKFSIKKPCWAIISDFDRLITIPTRILSQPMQIPIRYASIISRL
ncbi:MAG: hypothetical protein H8D47_03575 [Planctomycetes bacterium]|nr:hypothetical protein [Planctomycetota bacterium]